MATCLTQWVAGWLAGCPSHAGIVSKRLNLCENFFNYLKVQSFQFLETPAPIHNSMGNPFSGGTKYTGVGKIGNFREIFKSHLFVSVPCIARLHSAYP